MGVRSERDKRYCMHCKYKGVSTNESPCDSCLDDNNPRVRWNWVNQNEPDPTTKIISVDKLKPEPTKEPTKEPIMTNQNQAQPAIEEADALTSAFEYLNEVLFGDSLPMVKLSLTRNPRVKKGHFAENAWVDEDGKEWHEIAINAQWYAEVQDWTLAMTTLVHEMGHLEQSHKGTAGRESYHNKEYVDRMRSLGVDSLDVHTGEPATSGDRVTSALIPGGKLEQALLDMPDEYIFPYLPKLFPEDPPQQQPGPSPSAAVKEPKKKRGVKTKYTCAKCGLNMWGKPEARVACLDCNREMVAQL